MFLGMVMAALTEACGLEPKPLNATGPINEESGDSGKYPKCLSEGMPDGADPT